MRLIPAIDVKVLRDVARMRGQLLAIALVIACGLGVFVGMRSTMRSLETARSSYYAHERFGHVFARLQRAPQRVERLLENVPGVQRVQTRVAAIVTLDVPGLVEAATGQLLSLPDHGQPLVNGVVLRSGRMPSSGRTSEVLISEAFAEAHAMRPGDTLGALIDGKHETLRVVGTALSPEYTYSVAPGLLFPDDRRFGVLWMRRAVLGPAFDMEGAFNDVSLLLTRGARIEEVIGRVDGILDRYGGAGAIARADQTSAFFLENDLSQLRTFAWIVPLLFLAVAAFLLHVVLGRIVAGQREQIAAMKAFGYRDREVGVHYAKLAGIVLAVGCAIGVVVGAWLGASLVRLYGEYYRFPELPFRLSGAELVLGIAICLLATASGTWRAIHRTIALPPAEAMRPEAPPAYKRTLLERLRLERLVPPSGRIVLRELERQPHRALLSITGIAVATGMTVLNSFTLDAVRYLLNVQFGLDQREDVQLTLYEPRPVATLPEFEHLPGVVHAEAFRSVPVRLLNGARSERTAITGVPEGVTLMALLTDDLRDVPVPREGLVLSRKLASLLDVDAGESLRVEVKEGRRRERDVPVARIADTLVGLTAHMDLVALSRLLGETPTLNGAWLVVDESKLDRLHEEVKRTPLVAGVTSRDNVLTHARELMDQNLGTIVVISLSFSLVMALGVLYNAARITLAERARELASLRVLGYRRREVATILLGELGLLVAVATPLGLWLGRAMAAVLVRTPGYDTEQFRLPLVIYPSTYALATLTVVGAAIVAGWNVWRRLDRFDIVEVLKTRD